MGFGFCFGFVCLFGGVFFSFKIFFFHLHILKLLLLCKNMLSFLMSEMTIQEPICFLQTSDLF